MRGFLIFTGGLILGAAAGGYAVWKSMEKKYKEDMNRQISEFEQYYGKTDEYRREEDDEASLEGEDRENGVLDAATRAEMKARANLVRRDSERKNYKGMYNEHPEETTMDTSSWSEVPDLDDEEEPEEEDDDGMSEEERENEEYRELEKIPPKAISESEIGSLPDRVGFQALFLYENNIITDEEGTIVHRPGLLVGDAIDESGFLDDEDNEFLYVVNYALEVCYEIQKMKVLYEDFNC